MPKARRGLADGEQSNSGVADNIGLGDQADTRDHDHVGEAESEPELLGAVWGPAETAELVAEVGEGVEDAIGDRDEEDADDEEAEGKEP